MTLVRTLRTISLPDGTRHPAKGFFIWTPTARRIIPGSPDEVVEAVGFVVELDHEGSFEVNPDATDHNWVWRVDEKIAGIRSKTVYVVVPPEGPVDYTDLVQVNPSTFHPNTPAANIWYAYTDALAAEAALAKQSAQAVQSNQIASATVDAKGDLIFTRNDGTTFNAGKVVQPTNLSVGIVETGP